jgi:hypothetical protein
VQASCETSEWDWTSQHADPTGVGCVTSAYNSDTGLLGSDWDVGGLAQQRARWGGARRGLRTGRVARALDKRVELAGARVVLDVAAASRRPRRLVRGAGREGSRLPLARLSRVRREVGRRQRSSSRVGSVQQGRIVEALHIDCRSMTTRTATASSWTQCCGILRPSWNGAPRITKRRSKSRLRSMGGSNHLTTVSRAKGRSTGGASGQAVARATGQDQVAVRKELLASSLQSLFRSFRPGNGTPAILDRFRPVLCAIVG